MANSKISALTSATTPLAGTETLPIVQSSTTKQVSVANLTAGRAVSALSLSTTAGIVDVRATSGIGVRFIETSSGNTNRIQLGTGAGFGYVDATAGVGTTYLSLQAASVEYAKLQTSGDLTLNTGNLVIGTSGKGIDFSATPGTGTSELLADYEEGTWTPTLAGGTTAGSYTLGGVTAYYTKIGRQVIVNASFSVTVSSAGTGAAKFGGLPFTKSASQNLAGTVYSSGVTYGALIISLSIQAWTSSASTDFAIAGVRSATTPSDLDITGIATGNVFYMTFTYFV